MENITAVVVFLISVGTVQAETCQENLGNVRWFGSFEQVERVQSLVNKGCSFIKLKWTHPVGHRLKLILVDVEEGKLIRFQDDAVGWKWEEFSGFTKKQLLADDPADGWDLPNPKYSSRGEQPTTQYVSPRMLEELENRQRVIQKYHF